MHRENNPKCSGKRRLIPLLATSALLAGCGAETDASAAANIAQGNEAAASAQRPAAPASLPPAALAAWEAYARNQCALEDARFAPVTFAPLADADEAVELVEGQSEANRGGFIAADFNGDGRPDFIVMTEGRGCVTQGPSYGNAGPPNDFVLSAASGYQVVEGFNGWLGPAMVKRRGERDVIEYPGSGGGFHGRCGVVIAVWGWDGQGMDVVERRNDRGEVVDEEGCAVRAQATTPAAAGSTSFPPIPRGYYAVGMTCARAIASGDPFDLVFFDERKMRSGMDEQAIRGFEPLGNNRHRIRAEIYDEGGSSTNIEMVMRITGPSSFELAGSGGEPRTYTHCSTSMIPADSREWYES